jgi:phosphopantothenoylcysteine synthetase/decarboxylase
MTNKPDTSATSDLGGYEVLVCVCGGIAAYKVCEVVSKLVQRGCGVTVAMTRSAKKFVGPTTFQALTGRRVLTGLWSAADLVLIAPATANIIGKIASGIADDVVTTLVISAASPVVLAPAMNDRMWANPIVQRNVAALKQHGFTIAGPGEGWLACRSIGPGRMAEPGEIIETAAAKLKSQPPKKM